MELQVERIDHLLANIMFVLKPEFRFYADKIKLLIEEIL